MCINASVLPRLTLCVLCACNELNNNGVFEVSELDLWNVKVLGVSLLSFCVFEGSVWTLFVSEEFRCWLFLCVQIVFLSCAESCKLSNRTRCPPTRITLQKEKHTDYTTTVQKHKKLVENQFTFAERMHLSISLSKRGRAVGMSELQLNFLPNGTSQSTASTAPSARGISEEQKWGNEALFFPRKRLKPLF